MKPLVLVVGARGIPNVEGGAEKNAERLFPRVAASGYRVALMGLADNIKRPSYEGVELMAAPRSRLLGTDKLAYYVWAIAQAWRLRPRIVHLQGLGSALFLWVYKILGFKTVVRYGSADYVVAKWGLLGKLGFLFSEWQLRFADAVIAVTPALAQRLARKGIRRNVHVIANARDDVDAACAPMAVKPYILVVGRVTAQKNLLALVEGYKIYARYALAPCDLVLAGGLEDEAYVARVRALAPAGVRLIGRVPRDELGPLYAGARFYLNGSMHEGSSNAVLEAISFGAPTLLSDIPENRDFGLPAQHYFDPRDVEDIADMFARASVNADFYRVDPQRFLTWRDVAQRTLAIYDALSPHSDAPPRRRSLAEVENAGS